MKETKGFPLRAVADLFNEKAVTLQSWADKGWARITPAPGPGITRELSVVNKTPTQDPVKIEELDEQITNRDVKTPSVFVIGYELGRGSKEPHIEFLCTQRKSIELGENAFGDGIGFHLNLTQLLSFVDEEIKNNGNTDRLYLR